MFDCVEHKRGRGGTRTLTPPACGLSMWAQALRKVSTGGSQSERRRRDARSHLSIRRTLGDAALLHRVEGVCLWGGGSCVNWLSLHHVDGHPGQLASVCLAGDVALAFEVVGGDGARKQSEHVTRVSLFCIPPIAALARL